MRSYGVIVCFLFIINGIFAAELDSDDTVTIELPKVVQRRRKVKQIRPHWAAQAANDNYRATALGQEVSNWNVNNQQTAQNYGAYGGNPPWNYGNQEQGPSAGQQNGQQSGYYPPTGEQSQNQGSQYPQYPSSGSGGSQRPQPGYPSPSYPTQTGYPQGPQTQYPQRPQPGQGGQSGYPRPPSGQPSQPGYPQRPQPGQPSQPSYPQSPQRPSGSGSGTYQPPSPPGSQPPLPQRPPDNQVFPGSPFYPQIQPGLTGPPEGELESELKKYCRAPRGQFAVDTSCSKYVNCWDDVVVEQECAGNLVFSEEKKYCDFPENVNCGNRPYTKLPTEHSGNCSTPFETYRSPTNCGEFFVCAHGLPNRFVCPGGLAYNSDLGVCDYAHRVDCNGVPLLPVEEATDPDYPGDYENNYNNNNGANNNNYENNYGSNNNNNNNNNYNNNKDNENYYGSYGGSANRPYGKKKIIDEDGSKSSESNEHSS